MIDYESQLADLFREANSCLKNLLGKELDVLTISPSEDISSATQLAKIISKISPLLGNFIEYSVINELNKQKWGIDGHWERQDPGFPDAIFKSNNGIVAGIEMKAWFPFSTEITARFRDSQKLFEKHNIDVALIAWIPKYILWGKPVIIDYVLIPAETIAKARDDHYFDPPNYLVIEPNNTSKRTSNLQQTNTNGYVFQKEKSNFEEAKKMVEKYKLTEYSPEDNVQRVEELLMDRFSYRLDTNYAKIDRIQHREIENFKSRIKKKNIFGRTIDEWNKELFFSKGDNFSAIKDLLARYKFCYQDK